MATSHSSAQGTAGNLPFVTQKTVSPLFPRKQAGVFTVNDACPVEVSGRNNANALSCPPKIILVAGCHRADNNKLAANIMTTIISGTNRQGSNTGKVAAQYLRLLQAKGVDARLITLVGLDVSERNPAIQKLEQELLIPTTKFIFISPEYNGSIPGVLKSLIDNTDIKNVWWGKKALLTGVSTGRAGNLRGMEHLTGILHYVKMHVHPNKLPISVVDKLLNSADEIADAGTLQAIDEQLNEFLAW